MQAAQNQNITVVGAGPAGLATALALAKTAAIAHVGVTITLAGPFGPGAQDARTTAVLGGGIDFLKNLGVWATCEPESAPLRAIRIIDDRGGLLRAPEVTFRAGDAGLDQFGANIPNAVLVAALTKAARGHSCIALHNTRAVTKIDTTSVGVTCTDAEGRTWGSALCAGADGRQSLARTSAGISVRTWTYPQVAIVCSFTHSRSHGSVSTEFHRPAGPFTTVPLPTSPHGDFASSLVWVETPVEATRLMSLDTVAFTHTVTERLHGLLGRINGMSARSTFQLSGLNATVMGQNQIALIGEAAHVLPPIGAQGLNLGFRDAAALADCVGDGLENGLSPGAPAVLKAYHAARAKDVVSRTVAVDALNRSLLMDFFPIQVARSLGLHLTANSSGIKHFAMQQGLEPVGGRPRLMQPSAVTPT
jgi:2-octaprenyl-6-methoxyphenol hydroxylase